MTKLFDTAMPPLWYLAAWLFFLVGFIVAARVFLVNPLLQESKAARATVTAALDSLRSVVR